MTHMTTEDRLDPDKWLEQLDTEAALKVMLDNQAEAIAVLGNALPQITKVVKALYTDLQAANRSPCLYWCRYFSP